MKLKCIKSNFPYVFTPGKEYPVEDKIEITFPGGKFTKYKIVDGNGDLREMKLSNEHFEFELVGGYITGKELADKMRAANSKSTIKKIANDIADLVEKKNTDYNSSFDKTLEKYGPTAYFLRISDKLERAEQLTKNKALVKDEKLEDTLKDVIGYTLLYLNYMEKHNE